MRFAMTARTIANLRKQGKDVNDMTAGNILKVTRFRKDGEEHLEKMVDRFEKLDAAGDQGLKDADIKKRRVYNDNDESR